MLSSASRMQEGCFCFLTAGTVIRIWVRFHFIMLPGYRWWMKTWLYFSSTTAANLQMRCPGTGIGADRMTKGILGTMPTVALTPDEENDRMIELSRQFLAGVEDEKDLEAYQRFVESLQWDD